MKMSKRNIDSLRFKEVFTIWKQLGVNNGYIATNHFFFNYAVNRDLKVIILEFIQCLKEENKQLEKLLKENGVLAPPLSIDQGNLQIAKMRGKAAINDSEISAILSMNIASSLISVSQAMDMSFESSLTTKYSVFHMKYAILGAKLIELSNKKGWLLSPSSI
ncbi:MULTISPECIES: DUF3231 family protein [unclassified Lysinibacillus]|uniref:DUF3231 family protein n=1 Tax=unclassified Lysinibacillus TaxID=2636778 RepID=UPI0030F79F40